MSISVAGYPFITAYLKGEEAHLVTSEHMERLLRAGDIPEALGVIEDTDIGSYLGSVLIKTFDELDERLWLYLDDSLKHIRWFKPVPSEILKIIDAYMVKYDVLNIEAAWQGILTGKKVRLIPLGTIHDFGLLSELSQTTDLDGITRILDQCELKSYAVILNDNRGNGEARLFAQAKLGREYYDNLLKVAQKAGDGAIFARVIGTLIDMTNLNIIFRAVTGGMAAEAAGYTISDGYQISAEKINGMLALKLKDMSDKVPYPYRNLAGEVVNSYEKSKNITIIEEIIDRYRFRMLKEMLSIKLMSPLVIFWYLILKETEIKNLRLLFKTLFDGRSLEEIRSSLVMSS